LITYTTGHNVRYQPVYQLPEQQLLSLVLASSSSTTPSTNTAAPWRAIQSHF
jgi:hypothetical protein